MQDNWRLVSTAPFETLVLTYWPGDDKHKPVYLVNTKNDGKNLGKRGVWWHSRPNQQPTHWQELKPPKDLENAD